MAIDPNDLLLVKIILASVGASIFTAWFWHMRAARGNAQVSRQAAELKLQHDDRAAWRDAVHALRYDLEPRLIALEQMVKHVPTSSEFAELEGVVNKIASQYESLAEGQTTIRQTLFRIEDYLLKGKRP